MKQTYCLSFLLLLLCSASRAQEDTCRALILSGGANKGAYEAGVLYGLAHSLEPSEVNWKVISGVSAGSINTGGISLFPVGQEKAMSEFLVDTVMGLRTTDVWKFWPEGLIDGLLHQRGIVDSTPLLETMEAIFAEYGEIYKELAIGTVSTLDGTYTVYDEQTPHEELPTVILASSSMPGIFAATLYDDNVYTDGGTVYNTNMVSGIQKCREHVGSDEKIIVDVAICSHLKEFESTSDATTTLDNLLRYREIKKHYSSLDDILDFKKAFPEVTFRYFFAPSEPLTSGLQELLFTEEILSNMVEVGKSDVETVLSKGEKVGFQLLEEWQSNASLRGQFKSFNEFYYQA